MKIGILTMQRIKNYGSFLVAYSLKNIIETLGYNVEFVDYKIEKPLEKSVNNTVIYKIVRAIYRFFKKTFKLGSVSEKQSEIFFNRYDTEFFPLLNINNKYDYRSEVDLLIIGSDEVFNCTQSAENIGYSKELFGYNNNAKRLISYAASFGNTTIEKLNKYNISDEIGEMLLKFSELSVRDKNSFDIVKTLTNIEPRYNIDPVFLSNFDDKIEKYKINLKDYIIIYAYANRITMEEQKIIKDFAKKYNKKLVTLGTVQEFCDIYIPASPFEALAYIKNADYIITDTFHGTVFSVKYNKQFVTIIRESNKQKLIDLLQRLNMENRQVKNIEDLERIMLDTINYVSTNKFIEEQTKQAVQYIKNNIDIVEVK